ncbi:protein Jade-1 [Rhodamnia argentea]|uniref:Protein Jade-1 n=1 Tax=Rhodamnia argentea TaxID=178133 RepID=A0A8B8NT16_9MYRT|nr:protein Jade-1 [Rhodamnia argentea]
MNYQGLPPLKRFALLQWRHNQENTDPASNSLPLPAKKRKESRHLTPLSSDLVARTTTYCLPTKKRVWALDPDLEPLLPLDLNAEYKPCFLEVGSEAEKERASKTKKINEEEDGEKEQPLVLDPNTQEVVTIGNQEDQERNGNGKDEEEDGIVCAICQSTDGDPEDPIVFCDGCDLMAHTTCYGNPLAKGVPEGDWFCNQCLVSNTSKSRVESFSCCLCPNSGGALKSTVEGSWAHVVCALLVPEVFFEDPEGRDSINCSKVPKKRWEKKCYVCQDTNGCAVDCSEPKCPLAFHVTCGLSQDLCIEYREGKRNAAIVAGFCKNHTELWKKQERTGKFKIVAREDQR